MKRFHVDSSNQQSSIASASRIADSIWNRKLRKDSSQSLTQYRDKNFEATRDFIKLTLNYTNLCKGSIWIIRLYTLAIWIGLRAAKVGLIDSFWNKRYPSYKELCQEDIAHILLEYKKFADSIYKYI